MLKSGRSGVRMVASSLVLDASWFSEAYERPKVHAAAGCWEVGNGVDDVLADGVAFRG